MKKLLLCFALLVFAKVSPAQNIKTDSLKVCCVITGIDAKKGLITASNRQTGKNYTFVADADIISHVKKGDAVYSDGTPVPANGAAKVALKYTGKVISGLVVIQR